MQMGFKSVNPVFPKDFKIGIKKMMRDKVVPKVSPA